MIKKILVTGGSGFLGSHLCAKLLEMGHEVICLDNFSTGKKENIHPLLTNPNFELFEHDVSIPIDIKVDEIYNLAAPASPRHYQKRPVETLKTILLGSINMLDLAKRYDAKILQASTSEVYGDPLCHPQNENYWGNVNPTGIRACYDEGKRCAETLFFDYHREFRVRIKIARIFNTYGPNMSIDDGRVVSSFIASALQKNPIAVFGDGEQTRSFCYVDDLIEGLISLMDSPNLLIGPVNLGNPEEYSIQELAYKIKNLTASSSEIFFKELPNDDPKKRKPDISFALQNLTWKPKISLEEGLKKTISYFKNFDILS